MGKSKKGGVRIKQMGPKMPAFSPEDFSMMMPGGNSADLAVQGGLPPNELLQYYLSTSTIDRNYKVIWPLMESFTMKFDRFRIIYPNYLDGNVDRAHGRKIARGKCLIHDGTAPPTVSDISCVLQELRIRHVIEGYKGYSKDVRCHFENIGRIRYDPNFDGSRWMMQPLDTAGTATKSQRKQRLLEEIARRLPSVPSRIQRLEQEATERRQRHDQERAKALLLCNNNNNKSTSKSNAPSSTSTSTTTNNTSTNNKKKAKKRK